MASSKHEGELGEFEKVMQTRDAVEGLHKTVENSPHSPECLDEAMETRKTSSIAFIKYFSKVIHK